MSRLALLRVAGLPFETLGALRDGDDLGRAETALSELHEIERGAREIPDLLFEAAGPPVTDRERARARFALLRIRRDVHKGRAPRAGDLDEARALIPDAVASRLTRHAEHFGRHATALASFAASHDEALARGRRELLRIAADALVEHGIYLASRSLLPKARRLARLDPRRWSHDERHVAAKIAAYVSRFAAKTSPNGVFCSVALAAIEGREASVEGSAGISRVDVLLSLAEVRKVAACLAVDPAVERAIVPRPNPTLRERDGTWTFWNPASPRNPTDEEILSRVKDQPVLNTFLEEAGRGVHDPAGLVGAVAARAGHDVEDLLRFYALLVERGILIGEVEIPYSCRRRFRDLAAAARRAGCEAGWVPALERIEEAVDGVPRLPLEGRTEAMEKIVGQVERLPRTRPFKPDELFRVDSASSFEVRIPERVLEDLASAVRVLVRLLAGMYPEEIQYRRLVSLFLRDYPPDTDVEFLDLYRGFAEDDGPDGTPPLEFPAPADTPPTGAREAEAWAAARRTWEWFVRRAEEAAPGAVVEVGDETVRSLVGDLPEPRWAAGALFQVAARTAEDVGAGRYALVLNALFNGIGLALSRFEHLLDGSGPGGDDALVAELRRAWSTMERPGAVVAEMTFNHEARTANAGLRPVLFRHEIELPGDLVSPGVERIPLGDLSLRYDSRAGRLVLRSLSRGVEVIPVVSSGVNPSGIVSELIHIGRHGWQTVGYLPGFEAPRVKRWPRFVCGNVVLFRARWTFGGDRLPQVARLGVPLRDADFFLELARWRARNGLPRHVFVHTRAEPKPFYVDLESPVLTDLLRRAVANAATSGEAALHVTEMLPGPEDMWVRDGRGSYATEFLVQLQGPDPAA